MKPLSFALAAPRAVLFGVALVVVTNAVLLGSAAWNRGGTPRATLHLTERELAMPRDRVEAKDELFLRVLLGHQPPESLRRAGFRSDRAVADDELPWFDRAKLVAVGFGRDIERDEKAEPNGEEAHGGTLRKAYLALEYEGDAWREWLAAAERRVAGQRAEVERGHGDPAALAAAEARLAVERAERSRLFAIDVAAAPEELERRFAARPNVVIVPAIVFWSHAGDVQGARRGRILGLDPSAVHVPRAARLGLAPYLPRESWNWATEHARGGQGAQSWPAPAGPRYGVVVQYGRAREPWVTSAEAIETARR